MKNLFIIIWIALIGCEMPKDEAVATQQTKYNSSCLSKEDVPGYVHGRIDEEMIGIHYNGGNIYVCGPPPMMEEIGGELDFIGFPPDLVVKEEF